MAHGPGVVALLAQPRAERLGDGLVEIARDDPRSVRAQLADDRGADRAGGSGDVCNLLFEQHRRARLLP